MGIVSPFPLILYLPRKIMTLEEKIRLIEESESFGDLPEDALPPSHRENYYFVSYSHKDYKRVLKDILMLEALGVNIWYDKEMHIGENWREIAELYISKFQCSGVIFYLTENSISSPACNKEVEYVLTHDKSFLSVNAALDGRAVESGYSMLCELKRRGLECSDELLSNFKRAFPDEVLYLSADDKIENKARAILAIEREPLFEIRKTLPLFETKEHLSAVACRDNTIITADLSRVTEADGLSGTVEVIGDCLFTNSIKLQSVKLPSGLISIGESAFRNCGSLSELDLSAQKELSIGKHAFKGCSSLAEIDLSGVKSIGEGAFSDCIRLDVDRINGEIGSFAFDNTLIEYVDYVDPQPRLKSRALYGARRLREFRIHGTFTDDIGDSAFNNCEALEYVGPFNASRTPTVSGKRTLSIGAYAFNGCKSLKEISFSGGFDADGAVGAFWSCTSLGRIGLDIVGTKIADCFARRCERLSEVTNTDRLTEIGEEAFEECESLKRFDLSGAEVIKAAAFAGAGLEKIYLKNITHIGKSAFANNKSLVSVHIGERPLRLESYAFLGCQALHTVKLLSKSLDVRKVSDVFSHTSIKEFWLSSRDAFKLILREGVLDSLEVLYADCELDENELDTRGFKRSTEKSFGFTKYTRGGEVSSSPLLTSDPTDAEINEPDAHSERFSGDLDGFVGSYAEINHSRLSEPYTAFVESVKYLDGDVLESITLSVHTGKSFTVDGTLIRGIEPTDAPDLPRIIISEPRELDGHTLMVIANGEYHYIDAIMTELGGERIDGGYPLLAVYYKDGGRAMALSGADIESITVFNESFEAVRTLNEKA